METKCKNASNSIFRSNELLTGKEKELRIARRNRNVFIAKGIPTIHISNRFVHTQKVIIYKMTHTNSSYARKASVQQISIIDSDRYVYVKRNVEKRVEQNFCTCFFRMHKHRIETHLFYNGLIKWIYSFFSFGRLAHIFLFVVSFIELISVDRHAHTKCRFVNMSCQLNGGYK